ncbi:MAG: MFS transporter [Opitutaceae bacterium]|jgi:MFS family permease|nr:MFS transporter [Opitutaceae bacterium]
MRKIWRAGTLTYTAGGLAALFAWLLLGDFSWSMRDRSVGPVAQWYLKHLGVPNYIFALLLGSFPALVGLILGPVVSVKSDRHRGPRGRRIPFLLVTTPIAASGMIGLGLTPFIAQWVHNHFPGHSEMVVAVVCFGVFWAAFEFATIAATAVFGGLVNDVVPKELLGRFYGLFRAVSLIDGMIFNFWIFGKVESHYTLILLVIGVFYGACFYWVCLKVKEGEYPPPPPPESSHPLSGVRTYFRECFRNPYYVGVFVMMTVAALVFMPVNIFMIPYANSLGMSMETYGRCMALSFAISLLLAYPLGWLCDIFHPLRVSIASLLGYATVTGWGALYARTPETFAVALVLHSVLSGCYFTSAASLGQRLYPHFRFAQFASAAGIVGAVGSMAIGPIVGGIIDLTGNAYHHTFTVGCIVALLALAVSWAVHGRFMNLGGPQNYVAPE